MRSFLFFCVLLTIVFMAFPMSAKETKPDAKTSFDKNRILAKADLENGKAIYDTGTPIKGVHITFYGGPHWLRTEKAGCANCHGPTGQGHIMPDFCTTEAPGITIRHLESMGYSVQSLDNTLVAGYKPDGQEMDYCMPRWKMRDSHLLDLVAYLISLADR